VIGNDQELESIRNSALNKEQFNKLSKDVNFVKNLEDVDKSIGQDGYGTYKKVWESEALLSIHRDCDTERALNKMKIKLENQS